MKNRNLALLSLLCVLSTGCRKPAEQFEFIYTPAHPADTFVFRFNMLMDDPDAVYSTRFACRYVNGSAGGKDIGLMVAVTSPAGERFMENISIPLNASSEAIGRRREGGITDIDWPYRERIRPGADTGLWQVAVCPTDRTMFEGILGMGFTYKEKR